MLRDICTVHIECKYTDHYHGNNNANNIQIILLWLSCENTDTDWNNIIINYIIMHSTHTHTQTFASTRDGMECSGFETKCVSVCRSDIEVFNRIQRFIGNLLQCVLWILSVTEQRDREERKLLLIND